MRPEPPYRNVHWYASRNQWIVKFHLRQHPRNGDQTVHLGRYDKDDIETAARVADVARLIFCKLGFFSKNIDATPTFDGRPPATVTLAQILGMMMGGDAPCVSPEEANRILGTPENAP